MARFQDKYKILQKLKYTEEDLQTMESWVELMVSDAVSSRRPLEVSWRRHLKMYEGIPKQETRDVPIPNAPNIEVPVGATAADTINAQVIDLIFSTTPLITARARRRAEAKPELVEAVNALQQFCNALSQSPEVGLRNAAEDSLLDTVQLGSGFFYVPWVEKQKKTKTAKVLSRGPRIRAVAPEDVICTAGNKTDIDEMALFGFQFYYTEHELNALAKANNVDIDQFQPLGARNTVRAAREVLGQHMEGVESKSNIYDVQLLFCYYDIDGDGIDEDLMIIYNHSSGKIGLCTYNPMDRRPGVKMVYQRRAHMFFGLGVLGMIDPYEEKLTDIHNFGTLNMLLANSRFWVGDGTIPENMAIIPNKVVQGASADSLKNMAMADVYGSIYQEQQMVQQLANNRVGINDAVSPGNVPNRTPGITTMSMLQQVSKRFTPAFDSIRAGLAGALLQCLYRYQERLLAGDTLAEASILQSMGYTHGMRIIQLLKDDKFDEQVAVELTAASASKNTAADRQDSVLLTNLLGSYYQRTLELITLASAPETPTEVRDIAIKIATAASTAIERTINTFDVVRDPKTFVIDVENEINSLEENAQVSNDVMGQLMGGLLQQQQAAAEQEMGTEQVTPELGGDVIA